LEQRYHDGGEEDEAGEVNCTSIIADGEPAGMFEAAKASLALIAMFINVGGKRVEHPLPHATMAPPLNRRCTVCHRP
jgi:hypothetical protein